MMKYLIDTNVLSEAIKTVLMTTEQQSGMQENVPDYRQKA